jgi:hypothetical protein
MTISQRGVLAAIAGFALTVALASTVFAQAGTANDKGEVKLGYINCNVTSGWGLIFGSSRHLDCVFSPSSGEPEEYSGSISKFGADIGYLRSAVMLWAVLSPSRTVGKGALAGHYSGATASATVGLGAGANVLVGGMHSSISLQPISIEGNTGLNVAAGVANLNLHYVIPKHAHEQ